MEKKEVSYRTYYMALAALRDSIGDRRIDVVDLASCGDTTVRLGINWSAIGAVSLDEAKAFSEKLAAAVVAAQNFEYNGFTVVYGRD